jgi:hypothetical protein
MKSLILAAALMTAVPSFATAQDPPPPPDCSFRFLSVDAEQRLVAPRQLDVRVVVDWCVPADTLIVRVNQDVVLMDCGVAVLSPSQRVWNCHAPGRHVRAKDTLDVTLAPVGDSDAQAFLLTRCLKADPEHVTCRALTLWGDTE